MKIRKRDGRVMKFDQEKITNAIYKAAVAVGGQDRSLAEKLSDKVMVILEERYDGHTIPSVEEVQDVVEKVLIESGHATTAKAYIIYRQKRKEIREAKSLLGVEDDVKLTLNAIRVLEKRYLKKDENGKVIETPKEMFKRVAKNIAQADTNYKADENEVKKTEREFYKALINLEFIPNSPTLMNAGRDLQQLSACFVLPIDDSMESIFEAIKNTALIHRSGGGTGFAFSRIRPKGSLVKSTSGVASGPLSFMKVFNTATEVIKQGGTRRGANMAILRIDHPDILDFIVAKERSDVLTNFNISVGVTEKFMQAVENDEEYDLVDPHTKEVINRLSARRVFDLIVTMAWKNGEPGIIFLDRLNRDNPTPSLGEIESTNPCIVGNAHVSTEHGLMRMGDIADRFSEGGLGVVTDNRIHALKANLAMDGGPYGVTTNVISQAFRTGVKETVKIITKAGYELELTPDHKVMTTEGWIEAGGLVPDQHKVLIQPAEGSFNRNRKLPFELHYISMRADKLNLPSEWSYELGFALGWLVGDGWLRSGDKNCRVGFTFAEDDLPVLNFLKPMLNEWYGRPIEEVRRKNGVYNLSYHSKFFVEFFEKLGVKPAKAGEKQVPKSIFTAPKDAVVGFLQGLFTADGTIGVDEANSSVYIRLSAKSKSLLKDVQLLLLNLGIFSRIYQRSRAPREIFPYVTIGGETKIYTTDGILHELNISRDNIPPFLDTIGFMGQKCQEKVKILTSRNFYRQVFEDEVASVLHNGKKTVYDLTEPVTHSFISGGLVISNCGEQPLLPYESCNLGSINLSKVIAHHDGKAMIDYPKLRRLVRMIVHFLDNVIDMNKYPLLEIEKMTKRNRKIGLGVMGFADVLIELGISYNTEEAIRTGEEIMRFIHEEGNKMSQELAETRGPFPNLKKSVFAKGPKMRNATVTTIAPTGTISILASCSSGIEPLFAISYIRRNILDTGDELIEVNPLFERIARERGFHSESLMRAIARKGSVHDIKEIPEDVRKVFVTAHDITPEDHLRMQAAFQKYTDNAVSKTVNFSSDASTSDVERVYMLAYKLGCKGVTIYRDKSREQQVLNIATEARTIPESSRRASEDNPTESCSTCPS